MPRKSNSDYPVDWPQIAQAVKDAAGWCCVRCKHPHDPANGYTLTVHHLDMSPANCRWYNLAALCQRCHLQVQARVVMHRPWYLDHSEWFLPYVGGFYAYKYLGLELDRATVEANLDYYVSLEQQALTQEDTPSQRPVRR